MDNQFVRTGASEDASRGGLEVDAPAVSSAGPRDMPPDGAMPVPPTALPVRNPLAPRTPPHTFERAPASRFSPKVRLITGIGLVLLILGGGTMAFFVQGNRQNTASQTANDFTTQSIELADVDTAGAITVNDKTLSINGQLRANGSLIMTPAAQPAIPATGQIYYDQTSNHLRYYNGTEFAQIQTDKDATGSTTSNINNITNLTVSGSGNPISGTTGRIAKFTSGQALGNSILTDTGSSLRVEGDLNLVSTTIVDETSIWPSNPTPAQLSPVPADANAVELGLKFRSSINGYIKGIRFYKGPLNTGVHTGTLWSNTGTALATATFGTETITGWQSVHFSQPVPITAGTIYVASYHTNVGGYSQDANYFAASGVDSGPLHALRDGEDGESNGVFRYGVASNFPINSFQSLNYWVDPIFSTDPTVSADKQIQINGSQISSANLSNDYDIAKLGNNQTFTGLNTFRGSDTASFVIQSAFDVSMFTADTVNSRIYIGPPGGDPSATLLVLSNKLTTGDLSGSPNGSMYYNATDGAFRCLSNGSWNNCDSIDPSRSFSLYDEFMGGQTTSFGTNSIIGSLGWNAQTIGANGSLSFNPSTPTPVADRPGVLNLTTPAASNQGNTFTLGSSASMLVGAGNTVRTSVAVGSATGQVLRVGLHNETTATTQPTSGAWWEANPAVSGLWRYCYGDGVTATCATSGTAITANTWVRLSSTIHTTGTGTSRIDFTLNSQTVTVNNVTIDSTNRVSPAFTCYGVSGAAENCYWDYYQLAGRTSAAR